MVFYYNCRGYKRKCPERYVRQEVLDEHFEQLPKRFRLDTEVFDLLRAALKESHADERAELEEARKRLSDEADKLQRQMDMIYLDRVEANNRRL